MNRRLLMVTAIVILGLVLRVWLAAAPVIPPHQPLAEVPRQLGDWEALKDETIDADTLAVLKANDYLVRTYRNGEETAGLFIAYYRAQHAGESMHSPKNCLPGSGWQPVENDRVSLGIDPSGRPVWVNRYIVEKDGQRTLSLYWYQENGRTIASEYWGKIYMVWDTFRTGRRDGAIVRISVPMATRDGDAAALNAALDFARASSPYFSRFVPD